MSSRWCPDAAVETEQYTGPKETSCFLGLIGTQQEHADMCQERQSRWGSSASEGTGRSIVPDLGDSNHFCFSFILSAEPKACCSKWSIYVFFLPWTMALRQSFKVIGLLVTMCQGSPHISMQESKVKSPHRLGGRVRKATIIQRCLLLHKAIIIIIVAPGHLSNV